MGVRILGETISPNQARRILRAFKRGVFPPDKIEYFTVGRMNEMREVEDGLKHVENGSSRHIFVEAYYGYGKSHLLKAVESFAKKRGFAATQVVIDG